MRDTVRNFHSAIDSTVKIQYVYSTDGSHGSVYVLYYYYYYIIIMHYALYNVQYTLYMYGVKGLKTNNLSIHICTYLFDILGVGRGGEGAKK